MQSRKSYWLGQMVIEAGCLRSLFVLFLPPTGNGHQEDLPAPRLLPNALSQLVTAQTTQTDVPHDAVGTPGVDELEGASAVVGGSCFVSGEFQRHGQGFRAVLI